MNEQNKDATDYMDAAHSAARRRLERADEGYNRGLYSEEEYDRIRSAIVAETEEAWGISLVD